MAIEWADSRIIQHVPTSIDWYPISDNFIISGHFQAVSSILGAYALEAYIPLTGLNSALSSVSVEYSITQP